MAQQQKTRAGTAFIRKLPKDLTDSEAALRQALLDFLDSWTNVEPPLLGYNYKTDESYAVFNARKALLPAGVNLSQWIEERIGSEIVIGQIYVGRKQRQVFHYRGQLQMPIVDSCLENPHEVIEPTSEVGAAAKTHAGTAFIANLPKGYLTDGEISLREALLNFLDHWTEAEPPHLGFNYHTEQSTALFRARKALLPPGVPLSQWIEERIGSEIEIGQIDVGGRQREVFHRWGKLQRGIEPSSVATGATETHAGTAFIAKLPKGYLTDGEISLREALLNFLDHWTEAEPPYLGFNYRSDESTALFRARKALLPPGVPLSQWIRDRIGSEIEIAQMDVGGRQREVFHRWGQLHISSPIPSPAAKRRRKEPGQTD